MKLDKKQKLLVEDNINLVHKVINDKVKCMNLITAYTREDLFQIGCIGLCKAAATDKGGNFSTYAYRLIWNEICNALVKNSRKWNNEITTENLPEYYVFDDNSESENRLIIFNMIKDSEKKVPATIKKGIYAIILMEQGYTCGEIGKKYHVSSGNVTAWITRARKYFRFNYDISELLAS